MLPLGACLREPPLRQLSDITLFLSVGLAGTEVLLARELLRSGQVERGTNGQATSPAGSAGPASFQG